MAVTRKTKLLLASIGTFVGPLGAFVLVVSPLQTDPVALAALCGVLFLFVLFGAVLDSVTLGRR